MKLSYKWIRKYVDKAKVDETFIDLKDLLSKSIFFDSDLDFETLVEIEEGSTTNFQIYHDDVGYVTCIPRITSIKRKESWLM